MSESCDLQAERRRWWVLPLVTLVVTIALTVPFYLSELDVSVARWWKVVNDGHGGTWQEIWYWRLAYFLPTIIALPLGLGCIVLLARGLLKPAARGAVRPALYLILVLIIGPGLVANALLKDHWGRPRPREATEMGGKWDYRVPWDKGIAGRGKSFPCGHATVPAATIALWFLWRRRRPQLARASLAATIALTAYVGAARMLAGGHWLSDVLWAFSLMLIVSAVLHRLIVLAPERPVGSGQPLRKRLRVAVVSLSAVVGAGMVIGILLVGTPVYRQSSTRLPDHVLAPGTWRLDLIADTADVLITFDPQAPVAVRADTEIQGFGWPGSMVTCTVTGAGTVATVRLEPTGQFTELTATVHLVVNPIGLSGITAHLDSGNITVNAQNLGEGLELNLTTQAGIVTLPAGAK